MSVQRMVFYAFHGDVSAQLPAREDYKNRRNALSIENQRISGLLSEPKKFSKKLADRKKADAASKTALKSCTKKRATAADRRVASLVVELANVKSLLSRLLEIVTCSEADADKALLD